MWCRGNRPSSEDLRVEDGLMRFLEYLHSACALCKYVMLQHMYVIQQAGTNKNVRKVCLAKETPAPSITVLFIILIIGQGAEMALNSLLTKC